MLSKYIHELLYRYECVIIPEFGGILTKTESAKIDPETQVFYPPSKRLGFNSQLVENDGLLANHIASIDKTPYETALNYIKFEVKEWKDKLKKQDLSLENIGVFSLNSEGVILFEPDTNSNFLTDAFGLSAIGSHTITRNEEFEEEVIFDSISDHVAEKDIAVNTTVQRSLSPFYKYAAAIIILLAILGAFAIQILDLNKKGTQVALLQEGQDNEMNKIIQEATFEINNRLPDITIKVKNEDDILDENMDVSDNDIQTAPTKPRVQIKKERIDQALANSTTTDTEEKTSIEPKTDTTLTTNTTQIDDPVAVLDNEYKFHIIAGAFREPSNAEKKVRQLKSKGFNATIVGINKWNLTQVAFGSYATKEEAQAALQTIKRNEAKDAWLLIR